VSCTLLFSSSSPFFIHTHALDHAPSRQHPPVPRPRCSHARSRLTCSASMDGGMRGAMHLAPDDAPTAVAEGAEGAFTGLEGR
jgi:hypothetical protein